MLSGNRNCFQIKPIYVIKINRIIFKVWAISSKIKFAIFLDHKTDFQQKNDQVYKMLSQRSSDATTTDGRIQLKYSLS